MMEEHSSASPKGLLGEGSGAASRRARSQVPRLIPACSRVQPTWTSGLVAAVSSSADGTSSPPGLTKKSARSSAVAPQPGKS